MDDEKKVFSFSNEELREAEELNARADTRMTEEYKQFLEEHFGGEGELYHEHIDESNEYVDRSSAMSTPTKAMSISIEALLTMTGRSAMSTPTKAMSMSIEALLTMTGSSAMSASTRMNPASIPRTGLPGPSTTDM